MHGTDVDVLSGDAGALLEADNVAVVSSWSRRPEASLSLSRYLQALEDIGYVSVVVSTADHPLVWPHGRPASTVVAHRPNVGYDFGTWAATLNAFPSLRSRPEVLLTNDSLVGPFAPLTEVRTAIDASHSDVFALTESRQISHHAQSFFLLFRRGILADRPWRRFFASVRPERTKEDIVRRYELGVARICRLYGYSWEAMISTETSLSGVDNPTFTSWRSLFDCGVPMVKRSLVTHPEYPATTAEVQELVRTHYRQELEDWLPDGQKPTPLRGGVGG